MMSISNRIACVALVTEANRNEYFEINSFARDIRFMP